MRSRMCGRCHQCGTTLINVLDGEEWCPTCKTYRRYPSHGWAISACTDAEENACPSWDEKGGTR